MLLKIAAPHYCFIYSILTLIKIDGIANTKNTQEARKFYNWVNRGSSTVVEQLLHHPKVRASKPLTTAGSERVKMEKDIQ